MEVNVGLICKREELSDVGARASLAQMMQFCNKNDIFVALGYPLSDFTLCYRKVTLRK